MKRLLLLITALCLASMSFSQAPSNDLIENAIEITTSEFIDENLRLDLATTTDAGPAGCPVETYEKVYYKFTATSDGSTSFNLLDQNNEAFDSNDAFVIVYSAPDLNADYADLTIVTNCSLGSYANLEMVNGQSYYVFAHRSTVNAVSKFTASFPQNGTPEERQALIDLYNATDGPNWITNTNWNTDAPLQTWYSVTMENGHVIRLDLSGNALLGVLPSSLTELTELIQLNVINNMLYGEIPDFSTLLNIEYINLYNNDFDFQDFEPNFTANSTLSNFIYSPQNSIDEALDIDAVIGNDYIFSMTSVEGTNVQYQWYKGYTYGEGIALSGATTNEFNLLDVQNDDLDVYTCYATNTLIPDLIIKRSKIDLRGQISDIERDALIAIYNALDGPNWTGMENWNTTAPVTTWTDVTTAGNKVIGLRLGGFNPTGELPEDLGNLTNLESLYIGFFDYNLTGSIPQSIGELTNLKSLTIQANGMSGALPESIGNLTNLTWFKIIAVNFSGALPQSLGNLTQLSYLELNGSSIFNNIGSNYTGQIPASLGNLINLDGLDLANNSLEGQVPASLSNLSDLRQLSLSNNNLSGPLPDFSAYSDPSKYIYLENNFFDFSDLDPLVNNGITYLGLFYSPQRTQDLPESIESGVGVDITLNVNDTNLSRSENETSENNNYQWYKDSVVISGSNSPDYTIFNAQVSDSGAYTCEISNDLVPDLILLRAPITLNIDPLLNVDELNGETITVYPNPTINWLHIKTPSLTDAKLVIYDSSGRVIIVRKIKGNLNAINVEDLQNGTYILIVEDYNSSFTKRFIKN